TSTPMRKLVSAVGPSGSHVTALSITVSPKCSMPSTLKNTTSESTHVSTIDAMATMSLRRLFPRVKSRMIKKASSGGRGINQTNSSRFMCYLGVGPLPLQQVDIFDDHGLAVAVDRDDQPEADRSLRRGNRKHDNGEHLPVDRLRREIAPERNKVQVHGVEHQLDAHQDSNRITPEIGRASCRERVRRAVAGGSVEKEQG